MLPNLYKAKVGDVTEWATKELHDALQRTIVAKADMREPYFILVYFNNHYSGPPNKRMSEQTKTMDLSKKRVLNVRLILLKAAPPVRMLNTALWRVDNRTGDVRCIYILPPDKPMVGGFDVEEESETVTKSAKGMPIYYG